MGTPIRNADDSKIVMHVCICVYNVHKPHGSPYLGTEVILLVDIDLVSVIEYYASARNRDSSLRRHSDFTDDEK